MSPFIRSGVLAAGAASLVIAQPVVAAARAVPTSVDPLVSLSVFGTAQSRAAVCAAGASAAAAAGAAAAAAQPAPGTCVLPITGATPPAVAQTVVPTSPGKSWGIWPGVLGLVALVALAALLLGDDDDDEVSPD